MNHIDRTQGHRHFRNQAGSRLMSPVYFAVSNLSSSETWNKVYHGVYSPVSRRVWNGVWNRGRSLV